MTEENQTRCTRHHQNFKLTPNCDLRPPAHRGTRARRAICACISIFLLLAAATALVLWLVYRPEKPQFIVTGAAIYALNATAPTSLLPPLVSSAMQFTLVARNPNRRVSIYYDRLAAFVAYADQPITPQAALPPFVHATRSAVVLSPVLGGRDGGGGVAAVPVAAEAANGLAVDEAYGVVGLRVVLLGRLRWKAGVVRLRHYGLHVRCDVLVSLKRGVVGRVPLLRSPPCNVDV